MRSWLSVFYTDAKSKKGRRHTDCSIIIQLSNKMDNSLLAVRFINHKYIVVERRKINRVDYHANSVIVVCDTQQSFQAQVKNVSL